jgi:hypothetical protein
MAKLTDLDKLIQQAIDSETILTKAAKILEETVKARTRSGQGVLKNLGTTHPLPELKESTVRRRNRLARNGGLTGPGAVPEKSGLNRTGELLNSVKVTPTKKQMEVTVGVDQVQKVDELLSINKKYQFMRISSEEFEKALKTIENKLDGLIKKITITDL